MSDIRNFFNSFSKEEITAINKKQLDEAERDFAQLKEQLKIGVCALCDKNINTYDLKNPCLHWLLRPDGLKKDEYTILFASGFGYFRLSSYIRWVANTDAPLTNINDLQEDLSAGKKIEFTVKYKKYEWSLSCANSDFSGHDGSLNNFPHFHLQMIIDANIFIKFGDFHIPFNEEDLFTFRALEEAPDKFKFIETHGAGMQSLFDEFEPEFLLDHMQTTNDYENANYHLQTMIQASPDKTISGDDIAKLFKESKETGVPMAKLLKKLESDINITTIISPGDGVPEIKKRTPRRKK